MILQGIGREIVLGDLNASAQLQKLMICCTPTFSRPLRISAGITQITNCRVVVITAGVGQKPGETRIQLLGRNAAVFREVIPQVLKNASNAILIIATNPVDVMTHITAYYAKEFGVPSSKIIGTGTTLDTARFRSLLAQYLGIDSHHVHAYVLGEHGDSEVLNWSSISIGGLPLSEFCKLHNKKCVTFLSILLMKKYAEPHIILLKVKALHIMELEQQ
jgi:L-lactate dehydrogenase